MSVLRHCVERLYLEVFPVNGIEEQLKGLPDGAYIGITCSPKQGLNTTLELVERLQGHDFHLVPHVAARQVRDSAHLRDIVQLLAAHNVNSLFVPGGDIAQPLGCFDSSLSLLRELAEQGHPFEHVGIAAYPEGHPGIDDKTLFEALLAKQDIATYMVTQMCFDAAMLDRWLRQLRSSGIHLPLWLGLPGVMNRTKLFRTSLRIGVGQSARFLRKQSSLAGKLLKSSQYRPDQLLRDLAVGIEDPSLGIDGLYVFSFNQVQETLSWRDEMLQQM